MADPTPARFPTISIAALTALLSAASALAGCPADAPLSGEGEGEGAGAEGEGEGEGEGAGEGEGEGEVACPPAIDVGIAACVADLQVDPDVAPGNFLLDLLFACADAEPVAVHLDNVCASNPADPACGLDYAAFVETVLPQCIERVRESLFANVCVLPGTYAELPFAAGLTVVDRTFITSADALTDPAEANQLLAASADIGFPAASFADAIAFTDDGGFERLVLADVGTHRAFTLWSAHYGDTLVGRMFFWRTLTPIASVDDGSISRCAVERTVAGQPCGDAAIDCGASFACEGVVAGVASGVCVDASPLPGEGAACVGPLGCDPPSGLICAGPGSGTDGCRPSWVRHTFTADIADAALVQHGVRVLAVVVSGLAPLASVAHLDLLVGQSSVNALAVELVDPSGGNARVVDTTSAPGVDVIVDHAESPVGPGAHANGVWAVRIVDLGGNAAGSVFRVALTVDSHE